MPQSVLLHAKIGVVSLANELPAKRTMDLCSGVSYSIRKNGWRHVYPPRSGNVVLIDRRNIGEGSTAANTMRRYICGV